MAALIQDAPTLVLAEDPSTQETQTLVVETQEQQANGASQAEPQADGASQAEEPQADGASHAEPQADGASQAGASSALQTNLASTSTGGDGDEQGVRDVQKAIVNFASYHKLDVSAVTKKQVIESTEGIMFWATQKEDLSARGSHAQQMKRAMKWRPDMSAAYMVLTDAMKLEFRRAWTATKSFDFMVTTRTTSTSFRKRRDEIGKFVTKLQLVNILGGTDQPEAVRQADRYIAMCSRPGLKDESFLNFEFCTLHNDWLDAMTYFLGGDVDFIEQRAAVVKVCQALRAYAHAMRKPLNQVSEKDVAETTLGIKGYAELYKTMSPEAQAKFPKNDGSNNAAFTKTGQDAVAAGKRARKQAAEEADGNGSPGPDGSDTPNPKTKTKKDQKGPKKEKEVKEFLAMEQSSDVAIGRVMAEKAKNPDGWTWASDLLASYKNFRTEVLKLYCDNPDFQSLKVAALSPKESAKIKKEHGDGYVGKLVEFVTVLGPPIAKMAEAAFQIEQMASAKLLAADALKSASKPKAKAKGKGIKRTASTRSLPSVV
ncbi:unnamed protein product [Symbiodinium sp. CCMP2592]|nr:unnamed protein product [Symbiodinium sp. CCMP2592]